MNAGRDTHSVVGRRDAAWADAEGIARRLFEGAASSYLCVTPDQSLGIH
jgi:hypothetical protein